MPASERRQRRDDQTYKFEVSFSIGSVREPYPTYNILIISSRKTTDEDDQDSHFQMARPLYAALNGIDENIHINVMMC
jgi:vesicle coat complex subunit